MDNVTKGEIYFFVFLFYFYHDNIQNNTKSFCELVKKSMCLAAKGWLQGWADKLVLCASGISSLFWGLLYLTSSYKFWRAIYPPYYQTVPLFYLLYFVSFSTVRPLEFIAC
jgi:hypothetical protein